MVNKIEISTTYLTDDAYRRFLEDREFHAADSWPAVS